MSMVEPTEETTGVPHTEGPKIEVLSTDYDDPSSKTFVIRDEDHTLGNSLRYVIMKNPNVNFCGYSIPHPSEYKINIRIQTNGDITASEALQKGLDDLVDMLEHVRATFKETLQKKDFPIDKDASIAETY
ncbi:putative DNA-directed RNA polymerase subunit [Chytridium lagenaria]|nr:putative DNA-directed RNA polymerase subunit [Chytridium lagenaria]